MQSSSLFPWTGSCSPLIGIDGGLFLWAKNKGQKKPAHWERVNPSFGRVEETRLNIASFPSKSKFRIAIPDIDLLNNIIAVGKKARSACADRQRSASVTAPCGRGAADRLFVIDPMEVSRIRYQAQPIT
jgi:hypothetical protein